GNEVFRTGMPGGPVTYSTLANITVVGDDETINFYPQDVNPSLLREGTNIVAVEVHQVLASSSDISFDLSLIGTQVFYAPRLTLTPDGVLMWTAQASNAVLQVSDQLGEPGHWITDNSPRVLGGGMLKVSVPIGGTNHFYRLLTP
ncbi:MAG TPA: hypothetical protein VMZ27_13735, partial [Candidatus Saccharimonadales bacterium]|nr:hypothetical protein [Candidatus Saccharimonadales bacterium]